MGTSQRPYMRPRQTEVESPCEGLEVIRCPTTEEAHMAVAQEIAATAGFALPCVLFQQGERWSLSTALPMSFVRTRLTSRGPARASAKHKGIPVSAVAEATNRPIDPTHLRGIRNYLMENAGGTYFLPPLSLAATQPLRFYTIYGGSSFMAGTLAVPSTVNFIITDGQHRAEALKEAIDELFVTAYPRYESLSGDAVAAMITVERSTEQMHQDFADASRTKALPASLLAQFDQRNRANRLVMSLERECPLLRHRIDATASSVSSKSPMLFTANQLRQFIKMSLTGSRQTGQADFERIANRELADESRFLREKERHVEFINQLTQYIPAWRRIADLGEQAEAADVIAIRDEGWVCLTAVGLLILGKVAWVLAHTDIDWEPYARALGERVDWRKTAKIWQGNLVRPGNDGKPRIHTLASLVNEAFVKVVQVIGLDLEGLKPAC